jgi:pimeloyl-ACP methyl ester carboxylesterase
VNKLKWVLVAVAIVLVVSAGGFVAWASDASQPMPEALAALQSDAQVKVETGQWIVFRPVITAPATGLILYPGGKVDARAYAPAARAIAAQGYLVVITPMPLNLAVFGVDKASNVMQAFPSIKHWAIGGHSLGGSMAASFANKHRDSIQGIVFWASYPADSDNLSATNFAVASIYASNDGLATGGKIDHSRALLPADTTWVNIEGGNHAQFGWYGPQAGDGQATINRQVQQDQIMRATLEFLRQLDSK